MSRLINNTDKIAGVLEGVRKASNIITSTMGGVGKNVLMYEKGDLSFTKDGVSVAKKIQFNDSEMDAGAQLLINTTNKTVSECGDGTTLTSLLTNEFVSRLFKECENQPVNDLLDYVRTEIENITTQLQDSSTKIESYDDIYKIALTSSKSHNIASLIEQIYRKTGFGARISVELSQHYTKTYYEVSEGLSFDSPFVNPGFANMQNGYCSFENPQIHIMKESMNDTREFMQIADHYHGLKIPIVLIAPGFSDGIIKYALTHKQNSGMQICLIKTPGWGASVQENIKDLSTFLTGVEANKIVVTPFEFIVYNRPDKKKIRNRIKQLTAKLEVETEDYLILDYQKRISNLQQTSAIIYVGGITEKNAKEEFDRIEDAVGACKSALVMGYSEGQGIALKKLSLNYDNWMKDILESAYHTILGNANLPTTAQLIPYNVRTREYDPNLIDPTLVLVSALKNSFALAELLINTSFILHD